MKTFLGEKLRLFQRGNIGGQKDGVETANERRPKTKDEIDLSSRGTPASEKATNRSGLWQFA
jgi:hypothetical protein